MCLLLGLRLLSESSWRQPKNRPNKEEEAEQETQQQQKLASKDLCVLWPCIVVHATRIPHTLADDGGDGGDHSSFFLFFLFLLPTSTRQCGCHIHIYRVVVVRCRYHRGSNNPIAGMHTHLSYAPRRLPRANALHICAAAAAAVGTKSMQWPCFYAYIHSFDTALAWGQVENVFFLSSCSLSERFASFFFLLCVWFTDVFSVIYEECTGRCCWLSVYVRDSDGRRYCVLLCCCACVPNGNKIWFFFLLWLFVKYTWHFALLLCIKMYLNWTHTGEEFICVSGDAPNKMCVLCVCCEESWTGGGWNYCF